MNYECADLIVQIFLGIATWAGIVISLCQIRQEKQIRIGRELREQADKIAAWYEKMDIGPEPCNPYSVFMSVMVRNHSESPVYDVVITCVGMHGAGPALRGEEMGGDYKNRVLLPQVNPGSWGAWLPTDGGGMGVITTVEIAFRDSRGSSWVRRGSGFVEPLPKSPLDYYGVPLPAPWSTPIRIR